MPIKLLALINESSKVTGYTAQCTKTGVMYICQQYAIQKEKRFRKTISFEIATGDFRGVPMVRNLPCNAGRQGWIPSWGIKIPGASEQLSMSTSTTEPVHQRESLCSRKKDDA